MSTWGNGKFELSDIPDLFTKGLAGAEFGGKDGWLQTAAPYVSAGLSYLGGQQIADQQQDMFNQQMAWNREMLGKEEDYRDATSSIWAAGHGLAMKDKYKTSEQPKTVFGTSPNVLFNNNMPTTLAGTSAATVPSAGLAQLGAY